MLLCFAILMQCYWIDIVPLKNYVCVRIASSFMKHTHDISPHTATPRPHKANIFRILKSPPDLTRKFQCSLYNLYVLPLRCLWWVWGYIKRKFYVMKYPNIVDAISNKEYYSVFFVLIATALWNKKKRRVRMMMRFVTFVSIYLAQEVWIWRFLTAMYLSAWLRLCFSDRLFCSSICTKSCPNVL